MKKYPTGQEATNPKLRRPRMNFDFEEKKVPDHGLLGADDDGVSDQQLVAPE